MWFMIFSLRETISNVCLFAGTADNSVLQQAVVPMISVSDCRKIPLLSTKLTNNMLCAGYMAGGKDSCQGDSGGPLVCKQGEHWYEYGVTSWGYGCADPNRPGVYADVVSVLPWITETSGSQYVHHYILLVMCCK